MLSVTDENVATVTGADRGVLILAEESCAACRSYADRSGPRRCTYGSCRRAEVPGLPPRVEGQTLAARNPAGTPPESRASQRAGMPGH